MFAEFLYPQPLFLGDDGFLHIGDDLVIFLAVLDSFMNLIVYRCAFEIDGAAGVLPVLKDIANGRLFPPIRVFGTFCACFLPMDSK